MSARRVLVRLGDGEFRELEGPEAELVALVACLGLSPRILGLLKKLAQTDAQLAAVMNGRLEVDLSPGHAHGYLRAFLWRIDLDERKETA